MMNIDIFMPNMILEFYVLTSLTLNTPQNEKVWMKWRDNFFWGGGRLTPQKTLKKNKEWGNHTLQKMG